MTQTVNPRRLKFPHSPATRSVSPANWAARLLPILYEDSHLLAVEKPAGVDVGAMPDEKTHGVVELLTAARGKGETLQPINRLSRYESGVLLLGKTDDATLRLRTALKTGLVRQEYVAVVVGRVKGGRISLEPGAKAAAEKPPRRGRSNAPSAQATTLSTLTAGQRRTIVRCSTPAPNTHAFRALLRSAGLRLLGDRLHDRARRPAAHADTCLHLARIALPASGDRPLAIRSSISPDFRGVLENRRDFSRPLHAALVRRLPCLLDPQTTAFRVLTGPVEDVTGLVVEKYGPVLIIQVLEEDPRVAAVLRDIARRLMDALGAGSVYLKRFAKNRTRQDLDLQESLRSPKPFLGSPVQPQIEIRENGLRFAIRPYAGYSVGLFLDQRDNRARIRDWAAGKDVLNLFAYTCGFSVAAAAGGARQTVSVDVSVRHLEWGKENFARNGLSLDHHLFFRSDALEFLDRARRQKRSFDLIVLDPPSFAHGRGGSRDFAIMNDLPALVSSAAEVLRSGGVMLVSTSHRKMAVRELLHRVRKGLGDRSHTVLASPLLPPDFAMDPLHARSIWVRVESHRATTPPTTQPA